MDKIITFEKFNHLIFIKDTYHLVESHMSYYEYNELIEEGFFDFLKKFKDIFSNPLQKRTLNKLGKNLLKTKIELMKLEIEEDAMVAFKAQLDRGRGNNTEYNILTSKINTADKAKETKIKSLQDREEAIVDQMDQIAGDSDKLQKYINKIKFEIRIKANDATIRMADDETKRILKDLKIQDTKAVKALDSELE